MALPYFPVGTFRRLNRAAEILPRSDGGETFGLARTVTARWLNQPKGLPGIPELRRSRGPLVNATATEPGVASSGFLNLRELASGADIFHH